MQNILIIKAISQSRNKQIIIYTTWYNKSFEFSNFDLKKGKLLLLLFDAQNIGLSKNYFTSQKIQVKSCMAIQNAKVQENVYIQEGESKFT